VLNQVVTNETVLSTVNTAYEGLISNEKTLNFLAYENTLLTELDSQEYYIIKLEKLKSFSSIGQKVGSIDIQRYQLANRLVDIKTFINTQVN
jgi:hypothetical protein